MKKLIFPLFVLFFLSGSCWAQFTFTVSNTNDSGPGSLREAISGANAHISNPFVDTIRFNIPGNGPHKITLTSALPVITQPLYMNGLSQAGADDSHWPYQLKIELSGGHTVNEGLVITAGRSHVLGLVINEFTQYGIRLVVGGANVVGSCHIGTDVAGMLAKPNGLSGIFVGYYSTGNQIGTQWGRNRNLISGNGRSGIILDGANTKDNTIRGCYIGTDVTGLAALPNGGGSGHPDLHRAIYLNNFSSDNTIGGTDESERNIISGNLGYGIFINAGSGNDIFGNYIGIGMDGKTPLGNLYDGICIYSGSSNDIGRNIHSGVNVIGHNRAGIKIESYSLPASSNEVRGNFIGQSSDASRSLPNQDGVVIVGTPVRNIFHYNTIKDNLGDGIAISGSASQNELLGNAIYNNGGLGIDLGNNGVTPNDYQDADGGPNLTQNYPILTDAFITADGRIKVTGSINSTPHTQFKIEFFSSPTCNDATGTGLNYGEGNIGIGDIDFITDNNGDYSFSVTLGHPSNAGPYVSAYAVDPDKNTSEFSECTLIDNWPAMHQGTNGPVHAIAIDSSGTIYIGGDFSLAGGNPVSNLARWNGSTWVDIGGGVDSIVYALATDSQGNLYVGGDFTQAGGAVSARRIAKWDGQQWSTLGSGTNGTVRTLTVDTYDRIYLGGDFTTVEYTISSGGIVRWNGSTWSTFGNQLQSITAIAVSATGDLFASGNGIDLPDNTSIVERIARWNGSTWERLDNKALAYGPANKMIFDDQGQLYVGGDFGFISGENYQYVARYNPVSQQWSKVDPRLANHVHDLAMDHNGKLYIGGAFNYHINGLAQWSGQDISEVGMGVRGNTSTVNALAIHGNYLYVGGAFDYINDAPASNIARLHINYIDLRQAKQTNDNNLQTKKEGELKLYPAFPNPTNGQLNLPFYLPAASEVQCRLFDGSGRLVKVLLAQDFPQGDNLQRIPSNTLSELPDGMYFYELRSAVHRRVGKFVLTK